MTDPKKLFNQRPWSNITGHYPGGARQIYRDDERFWASKNELGQPLLVVTGELVNNFEEIKNLSGVKVTVDQNIGGKSNLICTLIENSDDMEDKFAKVAYDIAFNCSAYSGTELFAKVQEKIMSWGQFLKPSGTGLSPSEFIGFLGELYTLSEVFMTVHEPLVAVRSWIGPEGKKQDFSLNDFALEVKSTMSGNPSVIRITSLDQLHRNTSKLYLLRLVFNTAMGSEIFTLNSLYEKCLTAAKLNLEVEMAFLNKASKYYGKASDDQRNEGLFLANEVLYDVTDSFPFLSQQTVPDGIVNASYDIHIAKIKRFEVENPIEQVIGNE